METLFTEEDVVDHLYFEGNTISIVPIDDKSFCSRLGKKVPYIDISFDEDEEIYSVYISYFDGNIISDKYIPLIIDKFNCIEADDYGISLILKESELKDFCSFFDKNIWEVDFHSNW
mgnify:CR=1 FL=1